jgi:hypothetical protein
MGGALTKTYRAEKFRIDGYQITASDPAPLKFSLRHVT